MDSQFSPLRRKIGPGAQPATNPHDGAEIGPTDKAIAELLERGCALPDLDQMRRYRLDRITEQLNKRDMGGILLFDPLNIRYASDSSNMQVWTLHNLARACWVSADGYMVLWDFTHCEHLTTHLPLIRERRSGAGAFYFEHGDQENAQAENFAREVADLMQKHGCGKRLCVDRMDAPVARAFYNGQLDIISGQPLMEHARVIKGPDEIKAMKCAVVACEISVAKMEEALAPGLAEVELWSILHAENIARGGEWIETRILCSGPRTNPWMQEAGPRIIQDGEILAFDTDLIGLYGFCCDMSRSWFVGDGRPTNHQKEIYTIAYNHIMENTEMLAPGVSMTDLVHNGHVLPEEYQAQKYCVKMHGVGLCDEFPSIYYPDHFIEGAFDYELEPGMTLCVEAYVGAEGGKDGVKLENQVLITDKGYENLVTYPYDNKLLTV